MNRPSPSKVSISALPSGSSHFRIADRRGPGGGNDLVDKCFGFVALVLASVNIFGGFLVTQRMLAMYKKKQK